MRPLSSPFTGMISIFSAILPKWFAGKCSINVNALYSYSVWFYESNQTFWCRMWNLVWCSHQTYIQQLEIYYAATGTLLQYTITLELYPACTDLGRASYSNSISLDALKYDNNWWRFIGDVIEFGDIDGQRSKSIGWLTFS